MHTVDVLIKRDGSVVMDAKGFTGTSCEQATEKLKILLNGEADIKKKPEYYAAPTSTAQSVRRGL